MYKVLLIGNAKVGKTSFVHQFVNKHFMDNYKCTLGVDFALKTLDVGERRAVKLQLWDVAGTERVTSMMRLYYRGASACLLMFDITDRQSFLDCIKWKRDLDSKVLLADSMPVPCLLIGNKSDVRELREVSDQEIKRFARDNDFIDSRIISVKNNDGVESSVRFLTTKMLERCDQLTFALSDDYEMEIDLTRERKFLSKLCCGTV